MSEAPERICIDPTSEDENGVFLAARPGHSVNIDVEYVRADRIEELEAERDDYAFKLAEANNTYSEMHVVMSEANDKLAKAVWRLEQMRDDRTGYRHPSHYIRGAAVTLAELKGTKNADRT